MMPVLLSGTNPDTVFVDAFCGGCNVVSAIPLKNKFAIDTNKYMIAFWKEAVDEYMNGDGFTCMLPSYTEETYRDVMRSYRDNDGRYKDSFIGYVGSAGSWGGGWFKGYPHYNPNKDEDHLKEAFNGVIKQMSNWKSLSSTVFINASYDEFDYPAGCVIYCDPPYRGTVGYEKEKRFDHAAFWDWVRKMSRKGHKVYVSEYAAPDDFRCVWSAEKPDGLGTCRTGYKQNRKVERLFVYGHEDQD